MYVRVFSVKTPWQRYTLSSYSSLLLSQLQHNTVRLATLFRCDYL